MISTIKAIQKRGRRISARQVEGIESPKVITFIPVSLGDAISWWSKDNILMGGILAQPLENFEKEHLGLIRYAPTLMPSLNNSEDIRLVLEFECDEEDALFQFKILYNCGELDQVNVGETKQFKGSTEGKERLAFKLNPEKIEPGELLRVTLGIARQAPHPVLLYGAWLEIGID